MFKAAASIFNDVLGPVMRGPSSSHVAGAARIAELVRQSLGEKPLAVTVDFDINGSLAASHDGHGTDMGFICGILGIPVTDPSVDRYFELAKEAGVRVDFRILDYGALHPNNYRMKAVGVKGRERSWEAVSVGGGMIEMQRFDGYPVSVEGGYYELLVKLPKSSVSALKAKAEELSPAPDTTSLSEKEGSEAGLLSLKYSSKPDTTSVRAAAEALQAEDFITLEPILPTLSQTKKAVPFMNAEELLRWNESRELSLWELAVEYESCRGGCTPDEVLEKMLALEEIMEESIRNGLKGTEYKDRILGPQTHLIASAAEEGRLVPCSLLNEIIKSVTAIMETKSSMGVIVAAPTAGSCGCLPGTVIGTGLALGLSRVEIAKALLAAGLIGSFIANNATFAAEVGGCQVECGAGSGMAAAGLVQLMGGSARTCIDAASIALQNVTGLACDPVANRVEVPCLGKNVMGGSNALVSANMALAGYDRVVPLDETVAAIYDIGLKLPLELRCTFGGLGKSPTAARLLEELRNR